MDYQEYAYVSDASELFKETVPGCLSLINSAITQFRLYARSNFSQCFVVVFNNIVVSLWKDIIIWTPLSVLYETYITTL